MSASDHNPGRRRLMAGATASGLAAIFASRALAAPASSAAEPRVARATLDLVIANRILAHEGVVDAYGHVSMRHPTDPGRFLLSRSRSPALVEAADVMEFHLDGAPVDARGRKPYLERFIHGQIYKARPDINAVVHSHAPEVLPYSITKTPLRPVIHSAGMIGSVIPVWDIRDRYGDTNLLVVNEEQGADLARTLGANRVVLMRGHGFVAAGRDLMEALRIAVYLRLNASVFTEALRLGEVKGLSDGEVEKASGFLPNSPEVRRAWEYWATTAGVGALLEGF